MFQFAPVYVSAESMRWWLGRECFARHKCILATREEWMLEDEEDEEEDSVIHRYYERRERERLMGDDKDRSAGGAKVERSHSLSPDRSAERGQFAWYNEQFPPLALWVAGNDDLVDGRRLLRRFDRGREPHVKVVHKKIIEGYEHLDVIWAMDAIEKVGKEVKEVIWRTASREARGICRTPVGCEDEEDFFEDGDKGERASADGSRRSSEGDTRGDSCIALGKTKKSEGGASRRDVSPTLIDATAGEWSEEVHQDEKGEGDVEEEKQMSTEEEQQVSAQDEKQELAEET